MHAMQRMKNDKPAAIYALVLWSCLAALAALPSSCSSTIIEKGGWEGIRNNTLRVYVSLDIPEDMNTSAAPGLMSGSLLEAGKKRAEMIMAGFIRESVSDSGRAESCRELVPGVITGGVTVYNECGEYSCSAFMDFDITEFLRAARGATGK